MNTLTPADPACLAPTAVVDSDHPAVVAFAEGVCAGIGAPRARAVALYYAVRDGLRYDPYGARIDPVSLRASTTLAAGHGWCVNKAVLLAAALRAMSIPAALGYADVRNHLSTARMRETMQTDVFYWHGYTAVGLDGRWIKATPAFNVELCRKFRLRPLEFDGHTDSIYHPFDLDGRQHMEYLAYRGEFADVPVVAMAADFRLHYPHIETMLGDGDFAADVEAEVAGHG